jgi:hypothetical protein
MSQFKASDDPPCWLVQKMKFQTKGAIGFGKQATKYGERATSPNAMGGSMKEILRQDLIRYRARRTCRNVEMRIQLPCLYLIG